MLLYLLASPVFWLLDIFLDWGIRIAFFEDGFYKSAYYFMLTGCGVVCYLRPSLTAVVALLESIINLFLHFISFAMPIFSLSGQVLDGKTAIPEISNEHVLGFFLVGLVLIMSFHSAVDALKKR